MAIFFGWEYCLIFYAVVLAILAVYAFWLAVVAVCLWWLIMF